MCLFEIELVFKKKTFIMDLVKYLTFSMILFLLGIWGIFLKGASSLHEGGVHRKFLFFLLCPFLGLL